MVENLKKKEEKKKNENLDENFMFSNWSADEKSVNCPNIRKSSCKVCIMFYDL